MRLRARSNPTTLHARELHENSILRRTCCNAAGAHRPIRRARCGGLAAGGSDAIKANLAGVGLSHDMSGRDERRAEVRMGTDGCSSRKR